MILSINNNNNKLLAHKSLLKLIIEFNIVKTGFLTPWSLVALPEIKKLINNDNELTAIAAIQKHSFQLLFEIKIYGFIYLSCFKTKRLK